MVVILNMVIAFFSVSIFLDGIYSKNIDYFSLLISAITIINTIKLIKLNKESYKLTNSYYSFIYNASKLFKNKDYENLNLYLKCARNTDFYKKLRIENSDMPALETLRQYHDEDEFD